MYVMQTKEPALSFYLELLVNSGAALLFCYGWVNFKFLSFHLSCFKFWFVLFGFHSLNIGSIHWILVVSAALATTCLCWWSTKLLAVLERAACSGRLSMDIVVTSAFVLGWNSSVCRINIIYLIKAKWIYSLWWKLHCQDSLSANYCMNLCWA